MRISTASGATSHEERQYEAVRFAVQRRCFMLLKSTVETVPIDISNRRDLKRFITFQDQIYKNDSNWVSPFLLDRLNFFNPIHNPYFAHSRVQPFIAIRNDEIVGRISAHENTLHVEHYDEKTGFFGFFESINDQEVSDALFAAAAGWLTDKGLESMRGPACFSVNGESLGLLVKGFEAAPVVGTSYNPAFYRELVEASGLIKTQDLYAYYFEVSPAPPEKVKRIAERTLRNPHLLFRRLRMENFEEEIEYLKKIIKEAESENWGAVPMTDGEFNHFIREMKFVFDHEVSFIAEYDGVPVGFSTVFVDMNAARKEAAGRLMPFGLLKILSKKRTISRGRVPILCVLDGYRNIGIDAVLCYKSMIEGYKRGYRSAELSCVPESNTIMRTTLEDIGAQAYKTYRMYDRKL